MFKNIFSQSKTICLAKNSNFLRVLSLPFSNPQTMFFFYVWSSAIFLHIISVIILTFLTQLLFTWLKWDATFRTKTLLGTLFTPISVLFSSSHALIIKVFGLPVNAIAERSTGRFLYGLKPIASTPYVR